MKSYLDILNKVLAEGKEKFPTRKNADGKWEPVDGGVKTLSCPNVFFSHDMRDGFPLLTTKKMAWKTLKVELEGFIKGITDKSWYQERGCMIWRQWCSPIHEESQYDKKQYQLEDNDLGPLGYSHNWRNFDVAYKPIPTIHTHFDKTITCDSSSKADKIGQGFKNKYGEFIVIGYKNKKYTVKFKKTGYETQCSNSNLNRLQVKDPYAPIIYGVACFGEPKKYTTKQRAVWDNIISRCYNKKSKDYCFYGANKTYVCNRWLVFSNFVEDYQKLETVILEGKKDNLTIDKDIKGGNCYSPQNCVLTNKKTQAFYRKTRYIYEGVSPDKKTYTFDNAVIFAKENHLESSSIIRVSNGKYKHHKGWKFRKIRPIHSNRLDKGTDQLANIVETLRTNPMDRRMVCSAWNPNQMHMMALPPCHYAWSVTVIEDSLNLMFHMRSSDVLLGQPVNIASYGLLLHLLAKDAGLQPGNLSATFADCHIYENQIEQAKLQLTREPRPLPTIELPDDLNIFNWDHTQVKLVGYDPHPKLKKVDVVV